MVEGIRLGVAITPAFFTYDQLIVGSSQRPGDEARQMHRYTPATFLADRPVAGPKAGTERRQGLRFGKGKIDRGTLTDLAFEPQFPTMGLHQVLDDSQPESRSPELT